MTEIELYRKAVMQEASLLSKQYIESSNTAISKRLITLPQFQKAETVFVYYGVGKEVNTQAIISHAHEGGKRLALPRSRKDGGLEFAFYNGVLIEKKHKVMEPPDTAELAIPNDNDLLIIPGICFDKHGIRLGRGGGCFDRICAESDCFSIGLCRDRLLKESVPMHANSHAVNAVLTEEKYIVFDFC